jgi:hypothetical protein
MDVISSSGATPPFQREDDRPISLELATAPSAFGRARLGTGSQSHWSLAGAAFSRGRQNRTAATAATEKLTNVTWPLDLGHGHALRDPFRVACGM